jgi:L-phenylalanine/L-methionine N-acetyltransferase
MSITIQALQPGEWRAAHALLSRREVALGLGGTPADPPELWRKRLSEADPQRVFYLTARDPGAGLVGLLALEIFPAPRLRHAARLWMAVAPEQQGQGIGQKLLGAALSAADRWLNLLRIELEVHVNNERARRLYERNGFQQEGLRRHDMLQSGGKVDSLAMGRIRPGFTQPAEALRPPPAWPRQSRERRGEIQLRAVAAEDAPALTALFGEESVLWGTLQLPYLPERFWQERIAQHNDHLHRIVALHEGAVCGFLGLVGVANPRLRHMRQLFMAVGQAHQGLGVGARLLAEALELADSWLGLERVELGVYPDNTRAIALYERYGFVHEGRKRLQAFRDGAYVDSLMMARIRIPAGPG